MLKCMASNGFLSNEADMKISPQDPYEYLQTAELNQRSVGFIPAGTKVCRSVAKAPRRVQCPMTACADASVPIRTLHALPCRCSQSWPDATQECWCLWRSRMCWDGSMCQLHTIISRSMLTFCCPALQFEEDWHDEKLMDVLTQACQVIPRQPASSPSSAPAILERWRSRAGIEVTNEEPLQNAAWEVRGAIFDITTQPGECHQPVCALS